MDNFSKAGNTLDTLDKAGRLQLSLFLFAVCETLLARREICCKTPKIVDRDWSLEIVCPLDRYHQPMVDNL